MDYFDARYYSTIQGRFTSIDPLAASGQVGNPQTWNRYTYVLNNPMGLIDPTGMEPQTKNGPSGRQTQCPECSPETPPAKPLPTIALTPPPIHIDDPEPGSRNSTRETDNQNIKFVAPKPPYSGGGLNDLNNVLNNAEWDDLWWQDCDGCDKVHYNTPGQLSVATQLYRAELIDAVNDRLLWEYSIGASSNNFPQALGTYYVAKHTGLAGFLDVPPFGSGAGVLGGAAGEIKEQAFGANRNVFFQYEMERAGIPGNRAFAFRNIIADEAHGQAGRVVSEHIRKYGFQ